MNRSPSNAHTCSTYIGFLQICLSPESRSWRKLKAREKVVDTFRSRRDFRHFIVQLLLRYVTLIAMTATL